MNVLELDQWFAWGMASRLLAILGRHQRLINGNDILTFFFSSSSVSNTGFIPFYGSKYLGFRPGQL